MPLPCLSPLACPIPPPLAARLSSPPPLTTPSSPIAVNSSTSDDDDTDKEDNAFPIPQDTAQHMQLSMAPGSSLHPLRSFLALALFAQPLQVL